MYRWVECASELELNVEAATDEEVLVEATRALAELLGGGGPNAGGELVTREVAVQADDRATLLAAWLEELVFLAEAEAAVPERVRFEALDARGLRAHVDARRGHPQRPVKAVTYQRLAFERTGGGWTASAVLDV